MSDHKALGNKALQQKDYQTAISHYTDGINQDPNNHILFSNRAAAHLASANYQQALDDASKALHIKEDWIKGHIRKAQALLALGRTQEAMQAVQKGLEFDSNNAQLLKILQNIVQRQSSQNPQMQQTMAALQKLQDPQLMDKIRAHPQLAGLAQQPDFQQMISELQSNPQSMNQYMQDQRLLLVLKEICGLPVPTQEDQMRQENEEADRRRAERRKKEQEEKERKKKEQEQLNQKPEMQEKLKGNEAYKKRDFETALTHYNKAIEIDPNNVIFHLNRASVQIETRQYEKCMKECEDTLSMARENHEDFEKIAKIYAKMGNCLFRQEKYEEAIEKYKSSLVEHRTRPVAAQLKKCEQILDKRKKEEYIDPEKSEEANKRGGELFRAQKFPEAKKEYDEAIRRDPRNAKAYSNRATCYMKLGAYNYALKDLDDCLAIDPTFVKAYSRKGQCHVITKEFHKALKAFDEGLQRDPNNRDLQARKQHLMMQINSSSSEEEREQRRQQALKDPEIQNILGDPQFQHVLNKLKDDPQAAQQLMRDPQVKERIDKLVAAGVLEVK